MNSRPFEESDLPVIATWFSQLEWPLPPVEDILPNIGVVAETDKGDLLACGWLYTTGTTLGIVSWTATNPDAEPSMQSAAMELVIKEIQSAVIETKQIKVVLVLSRSPAFLGRLKKLGFRSKSGFDACTWIARG